MRWLTMSKFDRLLRKPGLPGLVPITLLVVLHFLFLALFLRRPFPRRMQTGTWRRRG